MINWMYFPKNKKIDSVSELVVRAFQVVSADIDSTTHNMDSNAVYKKYAQNLRNVALKLRKAKRKKIKYRSRSYSEPTEKLRSILMQMLIVLRLDMSSKSKQVAVL